MLGMTKFGKHLEASAALGALAAASMILFSGVANAAPTPNWDAVAQCESGGNWHANTGNGMYGGLQFKPATWARYGGVGNPATASREQQIAVANRVLADQGLDAWPKCGTASGLPTAVWSAPGRGVTSIINQIIQAAVPRA
jgi:resuscitation-promoting factor RpfC